MLNKDQNQNVGEGGIAIQANGSVTVGLSYSDTRDIALDVFQANFYKLSAEAKKIADTRATEITEAFLQKLQIENPSGFNKGQDPDFQHSLFITQKEYARSGDKELGDLLVDLLVDRSKQEERGILQIVLNESLLTAPKLTSAQLASLALAFLFRHTQNAGIGTHDELGNYFDKHVSPFSGKLVPNRACYQHLEFAGCGSLQVGAIMLEEIISTTYCGLFQAGLTEEEIKERLITLPIKHEIFTKCLNDPQKIQINALSQEALGEKIKHYNIDAETSSKLLDLFKTNLIPLPEVKSKCIEIRPYMESFFDIWTNSNLKSFDLTSVGMAIGHANIKKLVGEFSSLSLWIN